MATKKDLIEAQGFSRRRLLSAFTSGAPGGKELEPAKPLRAVAAGIALTAIVIIGGLFYGLIRPGLPSGWENNALILVKDTGARYVTVGGVLYPVINSASARLIIPAESFSVVTTDRDSLNGIRIASPIGIPGAPDDLPAPAALIGDGWAACAAADGTTSMALAATSPVVASDGGVVVSRNDRTFVVIGDRRYEVDSGETSSILRAVGLDTATVVPVDGTWLNLFDAGTELAPLVVPNAGDSLPGGDLEVGSVVHPQGSDPDERYVVTGEGTLAALGPLAYQLYLLGTGAQLGGEQDVSPSDISDLANAGAAGGADWPDDTVTEVASDALPCAVLTHDGNGDPHTSLAVPATGIQPTEHPVTVEVDGGALVRAGGEGSQGSGMIYLVDETGTAFPLPGADAETIARLGYTVDEVSRVPEAWIQFLPTGPALTTAAAMAGAIPSPTSTSGN